MRHVHCFDSIIDQQLFTFQDFLCSSATLSMVDSEEVLTNTAAGRLVNSMQPLSRRTRSIKGDNHIGGPVDGFPKVSSVDGGYVQLPTLSRSSISLWRLPIKTF
jgi:hypothetical protein